MQGIADGMKENTTLTYLSMSIFDWVSFIKSKTKGNNYNGKYFGNEVGQMIKDNKSLQELHLCILIWYA